MSSIRRKELDGRKVSWEARVNIKGHPSMSRSFKTKKDATEWAQQQEVKIRGGEKVSRKSEKTTVAEALDEYLNAHTTTVVDKDGEEQAVSTLTDTKRYGVESVKHHLGDFTIDTLSHKVISAFLKKLQVTQIPPPANKVKSHPLYDGDRVRTYTPGSARKLFYALKTAIEWHSHEYHYPLGDKFEAVVVPAAWAAPRDRRLVGDEEPRLMVACDGMYKDPEGWRLLIGLALETAMRAGELLGMQWDEINFGADHRFIVIPKEREKTRKGRQVPLSTKALNILEQLKKRRVKGEPRVFAMMPSSSVVLGRGFKRITKRAECANLHFHDLRHEAVARFFERTPLQTMEIALITGHTELKTLQRYANLRPAVLAVKLDGYLVNREDEKKAKTKKAVLVKTGKSKSKLRAK
jgi:integrase